MSRFTNKVALVTGGASGIGAATVRLLVAEGARVVIGDLNEQLADELVREVGNSNAFFYQCDVSARDEAEALVTATIEHFGSLNILFNNAGIGAPPASTPDLDPETWLKVIAVDLHAVFYACRVAIPHIKRNGGGAIVNTASISGLAADYGFNAYNAAKGAVVNYTRTLALDHALDNIRVNAICPGLIETPLTQMLKDTPQIYDAWCDSIPMRRPGTPEEMAKVVAFLASDDASYVTGCILAADGGITAGTGQPNLPRILARMQQG